MKINTLLFRCLTIILWMGNGIFAHDHIAVRIFNVGQGNCTVVSCPNQPALLVDAGSSQIPCDENGKRRDAEIINNIIQHIERQSTNKSLAIIVSHPDLDHCVWIGPIAQELLQKDFKLTALLGGTKEDYKKRGKTLWPSINALEKRCREKQFIFKYCNEVKDIKKFCSEYLPSYCEILKADWKAKDDNDKSIIVRAFDELSSFLLLGDATGKATDALTADKAQKNTVIIPHHGAHTKESTKLALLEKHAPHQAVISSGMHGRYHHMPAKTLSILCEYFKEKPHLRCPSHPISYYDDASEIPADSHDFKFIIGYKNKFGTALTKLPILSTVNMGDMYFHAPEGKGIMTAEHEYDETATDKQIALSALKRSYFLDFNFDTIAQLNFTNFGMTDEDIKTIPKLPKALTTFDLSGNLLKEKSIIHLMELLEDYKREAEILLDLPYKRITRKNLLLNSLIEEEKEGNVEKRTLQKLVRQKETKEKYNTHGVILKAANPIL